MKKLALLFVLFASVAFAQDDNTKLIVSGNFVSVNNAADNNGFKASQELMIAPSFAARSDQFILPGSIIATIGPEYWLPLSKIFKGTGGAINPQNTSFSFYGGIGNGRDTLNAVTKSSFAWDLGATMNYSVNGVLEFRPMDIAYVHSPFLANGGAVLGHWEVSTGFGLKIPW